MNNIKMGFKHTMLQRLQNYEVSPAKSTTSSISTESGDEQTQQSTTHVTDFSISRILSDDAQHTIKRRTSEKSPTISVKPNITVPQTSSPLTSDDILDLSKSSPALSARAPTSNTPPRQPTYPTPTYHSGFHPDFLAAAAAANATKLYAQFFPHMFAPYTVSNFQLNTPTSYQKRYFVPYVVNSASTQNAIPVPPTSGRLSTVSSSLITPVTSLSPKNLCPRASCSDCLDYYKQYPVYKSTMPSVPSSPSSSTSSTCHSSFNANYLKTKSSTELLLKSSTIALSTVSNFHLTTKTTKLCQSSATSLPSLNLEEISYKCCICDKVFGCSQTLQAHEKTHKSPRYECTDCGKGFSQLRNYKYHLSVHRGTKEFAAECPECGKTFNDKGYLSSHMKIHRNKKEYECPYCPKSFNQRVAFNMHVRIHTGVKPHKCAECGKRFSRKMLLKQHMRTHSGEKPYQCSVCGKSFADRSNMTLHHRLHSGIKPFNCPICPKAFTKKHHLKTHLNYHTGCKPYICPHPNCNQAFTQSSNMRTHAKKCQYRPLQLSYPVTSATSSASMAISAPPMTLPTTAAAAAEASSSLAPIVSRLSLPAQSIATATETIDVTAAATALSSAAAASLVNTTAAPHIPNLSTSLSTGMHMLSAAAVSTTGAVTLSNGTASVSHNATAQPQLLPFPPAQQPLISTLRPF